MDEHRDSAAAGELPPPPEKPAPEECCGSGCIPCIMDLYEEELERWRARCDAIRSRRSDAPRT